MTRKTVFRVREGIVLLERTPRTLDAWLRGLPEDWLHANEGPETFSPFEVVGHLIAGERADWIVRTRHILSRGPSTTGTTGTTEAFEPFDRFAHRSECRGKSIDLLLETFGELRAANIETLTEMNLSSEQLALTGTHPAFGTVTLSQLLATWVVHDQGHIAQIARVLAKRYRNEVGPWAEYLPVVSDRT